METNTETRKRSLSRAMKSLTSKWCAMLVVLGACAYGADAPTFHELVVAHYSFLPRNLNESAMDAKSKELDLFWSSVKSRGQSGLDDLRIELARTDTPVFFNYDGAKLLLSLSESSGDRSLALAAINRADIRDVQWNDFFLTVHFLAVSGLDTSDAAWKILWEDKFKVFIPQHSLTLDQEMCLLFLLLPTKESFYLEKAERRLFEEKSVVAQKSLLGLLANTATAQGDAALARFLTDASKPEEARNYAKTITETTKSMRSTTAAAVVGFSFKSYESLKEEQRKLFGRVSDEALGEWEILRLKIRRAMPRSKA